MTDIETLWGYACSGNTEALKKYYDEGGSVNNRCFMFGESHSFLMGAFRNNHLDTVEYLLSEGEELTKKEYEEFKSDMRKQELIRNIFGLYVQGLSLQIISDRLNLLPISYAEGRTWNKNIVKRILENPKYTGDKDYPVIIPPETARMALEIKEKKSPDVDSKDKCRTDAYRDRARCAVCGERMIKQHSGSGKRSRTYWKCCDTDCIGNKHVLNEKDLNSAVADILNDISDNLETIQVDIWINVNKVDRKKRKIIQP